MIGANSGLISLIKQKSPAIQGTHCMIHKAAFVSKTIPKRLHEHMSAVIKVVNYVKSSALNTRLFNKLCKDMDADHTALLYHTQVRWLSKGNMLSRIFELREEVKLFLVAKQKHDLLLAFGGDEFSTYLATEITGDDFNKNLKEDIISHLRNLQDEFERHFPR